MALNDNEYLTTVKPSTTDSAIGLSRKMAKALASEYPTSHADVSVSLSTSSSTWTTLAATRAEKIEFFNDTGVAVDVRRVTDQVTRTIADGANLTVYTNRESSSNDHLASQFEAKRNTGSGSVSLKYTRHYNA